MRQSEEPAGRGLSRQPEEPAEGRPEQDAPTSRAGLSARLSARLGSGGGEEGVGPNGPPQRPAFGSFKRADQHDFRLRREEFRDRHFSRESYDIPMEDAEVPLPGSNTGRLASAVKVERAQEDFMEPRKRPIENGPVNPAQQKRAKRLFGSLLGTLQKFQEEDSTFKRTKLAQDRAEAESRAEQRAQQESFKMREKQRLDIANARVSEINKKRELDVQLQVKEREIDVARRVAQEMALAKWLKTGCGPPIMWLPRKHNQDTLLLLEQRQVDLAAWEAAQVEKLDKEKKRLLERLTFIPPKPLPEVKDEVEAAPKGDTEMEPGEAGQDTAPTQNDAPMERFEAEEGVDAATNEVQGDIVDVKEESS